MVLLEPPAPAARVELGLAAVLPARRLETVGKMLSESDINADNRGTHRTCAPGGLDTALDELERTATGAASESDCSKHSARQSSRHHSIATAQLTMVGLGEWLMRARCAGSSVTRLSLM